MSYAFIGDVHSDIHHLEVLLNKIPSRYSLLFLGDVFDYERKDDGSDSAAVYQLLKETSCTVMHSNHQHKLLRWLQGYAKQPSSSLIKTVQELDLADNRDKQEEMIKWLRQHPLSLELHVDKKVYKIAHAYHPGYTEYQSNSVYRGLCLYGPSYKTEHGRLRLRWWESQQPKDFIRVAGHYHTLYTDENSLVLDSGCGSPGGHLTAYLTDTQELMHSI